MAKIIYTETLTRNPSCDRCELRRSSKHVCIFGHGGGDAFIIGEAPGKEEGRTGKPFMGQSGVLLRAILASFDMADAYITNTAKCRPPDNRKPEPSEIKACRPYLNYELETRNPKAVLLLGAVAMKAFVGKTSITEMNGQIVTGKDGRTYVCAFHPAYILRDPSKESALRMAIGRYAQVLRGEFNQTMPDWRPIDASGFDEFIRDWTEAYEVSFDVETKGENDGEGLQWWKDGFDLTSISFSLYGKDRRETNWGLALPGHARAVLDEDMCRLLLQELTQSTGGKKMKGHNGKFDNLCLMKRYGVRFRLDSDSMLAHHLIDENSAHGLKQLSRTFCGAPDYDLTTKEKRDTSKVPITKLLAYNCSDSAYTRRLETMFVEKMDDDERWLYNKVIMPAARLFEEIESGGLYVDIDFLARSEADERKKMIDVEKQLNKIAKRTINWNAPSQVAEVLYGDLGIEPTAFTDKGAASTGEAALVDIDHPIAKLLEKYRGHKKFISTYTGERQEDGTYAGGWRDFMDGPHLYLSTKLHGTVTGRYSSRLHQTPRDGAIRNAVMAPSGWTPFQLDLSQAELRVIAIASRDPELIRCFLEGEDVHWRTLMSAVQAGGGEYVDLVNSTARLITKKKLDFMQALDLVWDHGKFDPDLVIKLNKDWKEARKKAKGINFGFVFDQSPRGFIDYAKAKYGFEPTLQEATTFNDMFFHTYRALPRWHDRQRQLAKQDGFVRSMSGRKRRLPGIHSSDRLIVSECERQSINAPVQGFIGDYKAMIMVEIGESFPRNQLRMTGEVHDSVLGWIKNECVKDVLPRLHHIAEHPRLAKECGLDFPIPMTVDIEVGRWGAGKKWKPE